VANYDLAVNGFVDFVRYGQVLEQRKISRDPLSGVADGSNVTFHTTYYPILTSGSLQVYTSGSLATGIADYNTGEINLTVAPLVQPQATYTFTPFSSDQILNFLVAGFEEMETRWDRGWNLVDLSGNTANESSNALQVVDSATGTDPVCGTASFSTSRIQQAFLMGCVEYRFRLTQFLNSANDDYNYHASGGPTVDKSRRPANMDMVIKTLDTRLARMMKMAQEQYYTQMQHVGGYIAAPMSEDYAENYEWQAESQMMNVRATVGYQVYLRPF